MSTIDEEINGVAEPEAPEEMQAVARPSFQMPEWLKAKTGSGTIEDYLNHPMNFGKSRGLAQIIRGASGMFGALDFAIIDIVMGAFSFMQPKKPAEYVAKTWEPQP